MPRDRVGAGFRTLADESYCAGSESWKAAEWLKPWPFIVACLGASACL